MCFYEHFHAYEVNLGEESYFIITLNDLHMHKAFDVQTAYGLNGKYIVPVHSIF